MNNKNKIFVDTYDAMKRILDCAMGDELQKIVGPTIFNNDKYISAIKHGMCIASMLLVDCDSLIIAENENKSKITSHDCFFKAASDATRLIWKIGGPERPSSVKRTSPYSSRPNLPFVNAFTLALTFVPFIILQ